MRFSLFLLCDTHWRLSLFSEDLVTVMWANESFDPDHPDTYYEEVNKNNK